MDARLFVVCFVLVLTLPGRSDTISPHKLLDRGVNGGSNCASCSIALGIIYQLSEIYNETVVKAMQRLCSYLPSQFQEPCDVMADFLTPFLIEIVTDKETPDTVCTAIGFCKTDPGQQTCRLWPKPKMSFESAVKKRKEIVQKLRRERYLDPNICKLPGVKEICAWIDSTVGHQMPAFDKDVDGFSKYQAMRGYSWRGADCNDNRKDVHPGARPIDSDVKVDSNCNGIYGIDRKTTKTYEDEFCGGTGSRGIAVLGDSVGAHFHLPEEWFDARKLSKKVFENLPFIIENEIDWPEMSTVTGFMNDSWPNVIHGPMDSLYTRLFQRNRCNHRDYQNIAENGMDSNKMNTFIKSFRRDKSKDYPMFILYSLVGNDVCNGHPDTFAHMTTPQEMYNNAKKTMTYLDTVLPPGSHVVMTGLVDGRYLYDSLHNRTHPMGRLHNDVTYPDYYNYFNCLQISPCVGWMNTNATIRNMTTDRANQLSAALEQLANDASSSFKNFKLYYMDCPLNTGFEYWLKLGRQTWELIEPVDGFHDNQLGQALTAKIAWEYFEKNLPDVIGNVNPNNDKIKEVFGDQGGYRD